MGGFVIRPVSACDLEALDAISAATWDGEDYLSDVALRWMDEGGFFAGEYEGRVVGCAKLSRMPGGDRLAGRAQGASGSPGQGMGEGPVGIRHRARGTDGRRGKGFLHRILHILQE